ncbi:MAG: HEAT repeat domain-containing protein [bacterium]
MNARIGWCALVVLNALVGGAASLDAQQIADRVSAIGAGKAVFHFTSRPGVCGDGDRFMRVGRHSYMGSYSSDTDMMPCVLGPVQVRLTVREGNVERVEAWAGALRTHDGTDLGAVAAPEAARYLMSLAARGSSYVSSKAIMPAVLADSATVWPSLLLIAHDEQTRSGSTRRDAMFWLSRYAAGVVEGHRNTPFDDDDVDSDREDLKSHAVFVLSQLPHGEGVENLLDVARTNHDPHVRSRALFWLGQSNDPRALSLFESILRG